MKTPGVNRWGGGGKKKGKRQAEKGGKTVGDPKKSSAEREKNGDSSGAEGVRVVNGHKKKGECDPTAGGRMKRAGTNPVEDAERSSLYEAGVSRAKTFVRQKTRKKKALFRGIRPGPEEKKRPPSATNRGPHAKLKKKEAANKNERVGRPKIPETPRAAWIGDRNTRESSRTAASCLVAVRAWGGGFRETATCRERRRGGSERTEIPNR